MAEDRNAQVFVIPDVARLKNKVTLECRGRTKGIDDRARSAFRLRLRGDIAQYSEVAAVSGRTRSANQGMIFIVKPVFKKRATVTRRQRRSALLNFPHPTTHSRKHGL